MKIWTVYDNPLDFPGMYVARQFAIGLDSPDSVLAEEHHFAAIDLSEVRQWILDQAAREGVSPFMLPPQKNDDPVISEIWV